MEWQQFKKIRFLTETKDQTDSCVVLFHGYGADAQDLASLSQVIQPNQSLDWFFPQGGLVVPVGPMMSGRAWFQLRVSDFEALASGESPGSGIGEESVKTLIEVTEWLNHLGKLYKNVFIGGFSQGAILTSHCFYRLNFTPKALIFFSGFLISPSSFPTLPDELKVPFFQSHGLADQVLPVAGAKKLYDLLTEKGLSGQWLEFQGGHEIPYDVIRGTSNFLNDSLDQ